MEGQKFLGSATAMTAAGVQPMGSVFGAVPSPEYLLGRDLPRILPAVRARRSPRFAPSDRFLETAPVPCGCGA